MTHQSGSNYNQMVIWSNQMCRNAFGFVSRNSDCKERLYSFTIESDDVEKMDFLNILCRCTVNTMCRTDYKNFLLTVDGKECNVNTTGISINTPTKAMNALHTLTVLLKQTVSQDGAKKLLESLNLRFRKRVSRAFSFNKTPRKLKRAVSNMASAMSPVVKDGGIYPAKGLTLGSNLTGRRLASSIDLPELDSPLSGIHEDLIGMCDDSDSISLGGCSLEDENEKEGGSATLHKLQSKETTSLS